MSASPSLTARTPARTEDFFDEEQLAELRRYARPRKRVDLAGKLVAITVDVTAIFVLDLGPEIAGWVGDAAWPLRLVAVAAGFALLSQLASAPFEYWSTMIHDKRHGMSNESRGLWVLDQLKGAVLGIVLAAVVLIPLYAVVRTLDSWWLVGGLVFFAIQLVIAFVYPVLVMPRFNRFTPMPDGLLRSRIEEIATLAGTSIEGVYTMDGSKRSRRGNAFVAGFGPTKRVVVYDTMLHLPIEQIAQVVAHEIGHYRLHHIPKTFPVVGVQMLISLGFVQYVGGNETVLGWAGVTDLGDPAAVPVFIAALMVPSAVLGLFTSWLSRRNEREADLEALELLRDPTAFVALWPAFVQLNKVDLEPSWWERLNHSHPGPEERMQFGLDWAGMNGVPARPPEKASVPADGGAPPAGFHLNTAEPPGGAAG